MMQETEKEKMLAGKLYHSMIPELSAERARCYAACQAFNGSAHNTPLVEKINLFRKITQQPEIPADADRETLDHMPWVERGFLADYGYNLHISQDVYINFNCTILDECPVTIKSRTLIGPNVSLFTASHPLNAKTRNGLAGPEYGAPITIEEDCWLAGNVTVLAGVTIGRGSTVGAGSVVTKDVPPGCAVAGNPAKIFRVIDENAVEVFPKETRKLELPNKDQQSGAQTDVKALVERMERLEAELKEVKEELKRRL